MNEEIQDAIDILQRYVDGSETPLTKIGASKAIKALEARPVVDVEGLKKPKTGEGLIGGVPDQKEIIGDHVQRGWIAFNGALYDPEYYAVVPVEPTEAMIQAASPFPFNEITIKALVADWQAMIKAAQE